MPSCTSHSTDAVRTAVSMACDITIRIPGRVAERAGADAVTQAVDGALQVFADVDRTCTRFDPTSDLMRANRAGDEWTRVDLRCHDAIAEAFAAYRRTGGRFDPRVLDDLTRLGYGRSWTAGIPRPRDVRVLAGRDRLEPWRPRFRRNDRTVSVGTRAVDLGGIGKGLALRWAGDVLRAHGIDDALLNAGGDTWCLGTPDDDEVWRVAVESPTGATEPVAVLEVRDRAVATSSVRVRSWDIGGVPVHHLIDPSTGLPGGAGLRAVTVIDHDPATAEVWSKVLFLTGRAGVATFAALHGIAALWVGDDGVTGWSDPMAGHVSWSHRQ